MVPLGDDISGYLGRRARWSPRARDGNPPGRSPSSCQFAGNAITAEASGFSASPWAYNGKLFALSEDGDTFVMQTGPEFKVLGKNSLDEMTLATPAIANGSLILRTASKLYRIGRP